MTFCEGLLPCTTFWRQTLEFVEILKKTFLTKLANMSDTKTDSDDSIVFVGVSTTIKVTADVHNQETSVPETPKHPRKRKILNTNPNEPTCIPETQGKHNINITFPTETKSRIIHKINASFHRLMAKFFRYATFCVRYTLKKLPKHKIVHVCKVYFTKNV